MPREGRTWSDLDVAAMNYISQLREISGTPALRKMADETGIKFNRISDLLKQKNGTPTLQEFTSLCLLFGERPSRVLERVMRTVEQAGVQVEDMVSSEPDWLAMAAKHGDIDAEQEAYEELP
ncbi:hypothetical protein [Bifidobacterium samirii]|uniref:HTH cro/C1-type domain-containing protein n=1 Tax=Bifidobacterium samirii TaxID=2306974 RepID=A0A430FUA9_9BIFI|nr:hypothetical protein [Bifidobacterium samirii]RSX56737.1 hypothetical protein D2E24_1027 [Bifidobacterium samirii]